MNDEKQLKEFKETLIEDIKRCDEWDELCYSCLSCIRAIISPAIKKQKIKKQGDVD